VSLDVEPTRHLSFDALFNVRDLGGYRTADGRHTRWRTLYRADGLNRAQGDDLARLSELGLRTVLDLRSPTELAERGSFPIDELPVSYHHLPMLQQTWEGKAIGPDVEAAAFLTLRYREMLDEGRDAIAAAFAVLADADAYPAVFHCAAGKDRTGVLAALVLGVVGVPDDTIATDYGLSRVGMAAMVEWVRVNRPEVLDAMIDQPGVLLEAPPLAMHGLLAELRAEHGSIAGYLEAIGVGGDVVSSLRDNVLD